MSRISIDITNHQQIYIDENGNKVTPPGQPRRILEASRLTDNAGVAEQSSTDKGGEEEASNSQAV